MDIYYEMYTAYCLNNSVESLERATRIFNKEPCRKERIVHGCLFKKPCIKTVRATRTFNKEPGRKMEIVHGFLYN